MSSSRTASSNSKHPAEHQHHADLKHIGAHLPLQAPAAGARAATDQEPGHRYEAVDLGFQAYVDGLASVLDGSSHPATVDV